MPRQAPTSSFFERETPLPSDPHTDQEGEQINTDQTGRAKMRAEHRGDKGIIIEQYPATHTYTVESERSGTLRGVQRIAQAPSDKRLLPEGTQVCVTHDFGTPMIIGVLNYTESLSADDAPTSITGVANTGADDLTNPTNASGNFRPNGTPRDLSANDWAEVSPSGNAIAVLDGGANVMKSSDFSQVRTHLINDLVEIISDRFRHITSLGYSEIKNEGGKVSYQFRGGSDQVNESGSDQENWTIRLDAGSSGDLFNFELTEPSGTVVFQLHVSPDGKADVYAAKGFHWKSGEQTTTKNLKDEITETKGSSTKTVGGKETRKIRGERETTVSSNDSVMVGNDANVGVVRHFTKSVGGDAKYKFVGGNPAVANPSNTALDYEIVNGSWRINIGDPVSAASPAALAGFDLTTTFGDIAMAVAAKGNVDFSTLLGDASLKTTAGVATLKTGAGVANVDGTTVNLGPVTTSFANPIIRGTLHTTAMSSYLGSNMSAYAALSTITTMSTVALSFGFPTSVWSLASPIIIAWLSSLTAMLGALMGSSNALLSALPDTLSTKSFTA